MHNPFLVVHIKENETLKLLWDFVIQNGSINLGQTTRPSDNQQQQQQQQQKIEMRISQIVNFAVPEDCWVKLKESEKVPGPCLGTGKTVGYDIDGATNCYWCARYNHHRIGAWTRGIGNKRSNWDHQNYGIVEIDQNTEKSPGDLRKLAVTQTPVRDCWLALLGKTV